MNGRRSQRLAVVFATLAIAACSAARAPGPEPRQPGAVAAPAARSATPIAALRTYISRSWPALTRSHRDLPRAVQDPKVPHTAGQPWRLYVAPEDHRAIEATLARALSPADLAGIEVRVLPPRAATLPMREQGLLYLPEPYVVPGGRFNEMYGWDSYFILLGLLEDGQVTLARQMTENLLYEVVRYGMVLNANRTYYLTRSQPPFLSAMVLAVFERTRDVRWLAAAVPALEAYHRFWTRPPHLAGDLGLSRYFDLGEGPAPEVVAGERDARGRTHYERVRQALRAGEAGPESAGLYDRARDALTPLFYAGDRAMRESGFDPTNRFGPFGGFTTHFAPVCLNALLYRMEVDLGTIATRLGHADQARAWATTAEQRKQAIETWLWDPETGLYLDYDVERRARRRYPFATTFFPLWAGLASPEHARRIAERLSVFERPGGLVTSTEITGNQWDAPFGWAPLQLLAVEGLRAYGFRAEADRIARAFVALVTKEFVQHGTIVEKYDVVRAESEVSADLRFGYATNEIGFGWTNAVVLRFANQLGL